MTSNITNLGHPFVKVGPAYPTIEQAQNKHVDIFYLAAIFQTPEGYRLAVLAPSVSWPPHGEAKMIREQFGWHMVAICDIFLGEWEAYMEAGDDDK